VSLGQEIPHIRNKTWKRVRKKGEVTDIRALIHHATPSFTCQLPHPNQNRRSMTNRQAKDDISLPGTRRYKIL